MQTTSRSNKGFLNIWPLYVFISLWCVLFVLYLPAARAGFVSDFTGWLNAIRHTSFLNYINRAHFASSDLYQVTQLTTCIFYKLFGANPWAWHLLHLTLHALNCTLLYTLCSRLLKDTLVLNPSVTAFCGVLLYCLSPYISEVIVWEPSFHYLLGMLFILLILVQVQGYIHSPKRRYIWVALAVYIVSSFSIEIFYITPWLILAMGAYYAALQSDGRVMRRVAGLFFMPMLLVFAGHLVLYRCLYGGWVAHIGTQTVTGIELSSFGKPAKYLFHLLLMGRFFSEQTRHAVYTFCDSKAGLALFYTLIATSVIVIVARFRAIKGVWKAASLLWIWTLITLAILVPLWFYDSFLVVYDRYTYFTCAFVYILVAVAISAITVKYVKVGLFLIFALVNLRFAIQVNRYWMKSQRTITSLLEGLPPLNGKTAILLNTPTWLHGVQMIGATSEGEYATMHTLLLPEKKLDGKVYDGAGYNMLTPEDGAHVTVLNDSTCRVTLNQWGTWWWYNGFGAGSYHNADYRINMIDAGHFYELTLAKPAQQYILLYQVGPQWKVVDWSKKQQDQD